MISQEKIKECLTNLGYSLQDRGPYWQTNAIFRNGDNRTAIQIYKDSGVWKDHVQNSPFSPLKRLVEMTLGTNDPKELKKYLEDDDIGSNYNKKKFSEKLEMEEIYPENCINKLLPHYKFYNDKNISSDILKSLKSGYATSGKLNNRFIFPIYNEHGQIHGFSGMEARGQEERLGISTLCEPKNKRIYKQDGRSYICRKHRRLVKPKPKWT